MSAQHIDGFEVPIHASLGSPILLGGAAFVWLVVLAVLQVVRRTGAAA